MSLSLYSPMSLSSLRINALVRCSSCVVLLLLMLAGGRRTVVAVYVKNETQ